MSRGPVYWEGDPDVRFPLAEEIKFGAILEPAVSSGRAGGLSEPGILAAEIQRENRVLIQIAADIMSTDTL